MVNAYLDRRQLLGSIAAGVLTSLAPIAARSEVPRRMVLVHGRAQGERDPAEVSAEWLAALEEGSARTGIPLPSEVEVSFPFYGARLDELVEQTRVEPAGLITEKGSSTQDEYLEFQAELTQEIGQELGVTEADVDAQYGDNPREKGPLNWAWVHAIAKAVDAKSDAITASALERFTRDAFLYLERDAIRDEIDAIVAAEMSDVPTVVVGHSLGSVVAYNVLRKSAPTPKMPLFVTVGSPLGIKAVRTRLAPIEFPRNVGVWSNFFDDRDIVALHPLDASNFQVTPGVNNFGNINNRTKNRHGISGYLNVAEVAQPILQTLN